MNYKFKKVLAVILCMVMVLSNTVTYFAETNNNGEETTTVESVTTEATSTTGEVTTSTTNVGEKSSEGVAPSENEDGEGGSSDATEAEEDESDSSSEPEETTNTEASSEDLEETTTTASSESSSENSDSESTSTSSVDASTNATDTTTSSVVPEENTATVSEAENTGSTDSENENGDTLSIATFSEAKVNETTIEHIENIATASEIVVATVSDATSDDNEGFGTGFLDLDYSAQRVMPFFMNALFGIGLDPSYDSRTVMNPAAPTMSIIPPVRNQGSHETCWAFSTIGMMEINARKQGLVTTEDESNLSEAALAYFTYDGMKQALDSSQSDYSDAIDKPGLEGYDQTFLITTPDVDFSQFRGRQDIAAMALSSYVGATVEDTNTAYSNIDTIINNFASSGRGLPGRYAFNNNSLVMKDVKFMNKNDTNLIKQAIMNYGSVGIAYLEGYGPNYYNNVDGEYYRYYPNNDGANHAIIIVGWDDNVPKENFKAGARPSSNGAWLCRNSYGDTFTYSNGGYFWLSYEDRSLDDTMYAIEVVKADTYDYNYHYDTNGEVNSLTYNVDVSSTNPLRFANIFKVSNDYDQILKAVSVGINSTNTTFNIKVYTKATAMSFPADGTLAASATVTGATKDTTGIYTIELSSPVPLVKNTYYSIIVEATGGTYLGTPNRFAMYISNAEHSISRDVQRFLKFRNAAELNQSFYGGGTITSASNWRDINKDSAGTSTLQTIDGVLCGRNWRIKGLTTKTILLSFDGNGADNTMSPQPMTIGVEDNIKPNEFTKHGYTFAGWLREGTTSPVIGDGDPITITANTTLIAQWTPVTYTINYDANDGTVTPASFSKTFDTEYTGTLATPTKLGYDFGGWYVDDDTFATAFTSTTDIYVEGQTTPYYIYAKWTPVTYTITYNANGGTASPTSFEKTYGVEYTGTFATATKMGYTLEGWYVDNGTFANPYTSTTDIYNTTSTIFEIFAKWTPINYTITLNPGSGGTVSPTSVTKTYGTDMDVTTLPNPTKPGNTFVEWCVDSATNIAYTGGDNIYTTSQTIYLYAKYNPITYTLALNALGGNPGTTPVPTQYTYGTALNLPMDYIRDELPIIGWYLDETYSGTRYTSIPAQAPTELIPASSTDPITLYARYGQPHYITFVSGGGSGTMGVQTIYEGLPVVLNGVTFYKDGYSFNIWRASNGAAYINRQNIGLINTDLTLTAEWTKNSGGGTSGGGGGGGGGGGIPAQAKADTTTTLSVSFNDIPLSYANAATSTWKADALGKWHLTTVNALGQVEEVKNSWVCMDVEAEVNGQKTLVKDFYFFDSNGDMLTGWLTDGSGKKFYLDTSTGSEMGKMARGWKAIGTNYYYFNADGTLFSGGVTPDGFTVDANGVWLK